MEIYLVTSCPALLLLLYWTCFCIHTTGVKGRIHICKRHKKNHYNWHSKAVHLKGLSTSRLWYICWCKETQSFAYTSFIILIPVNPCGREGQRPPLSDPASSITQYFKTSDTSIRPLWAHMRCHNAVINQDFKVDRGPFYFKAPGDNDHYRTGEDAAHRGEHIQ